MSACLLFYPPQYRRQGNGLTHNLGGAAGECVSLVSVVGSSAADHRAPAPGTIVETGWSLSSSRSTSRRSCRHSRASTTCCGPTRRRGNANLLAGSLLPASVWHPGSVTDAAGTPIPAWWNTDPRADNPALEVKA